MIGKTTKPESEKTLEARFVSEVRKRGGIAVKLTSQFHRGLPDRLGLLPYHTICFVEFKSSGKNTTALQNKAIALLRSMRFTCRVVDSTEALDEVMAAIDARIAEQKGMEETINDMQKTVRRDYIREHKVATLEAKAKRKNQQ